MFNWFDKHNRHYIWNIIALIPMLLSSVYSSFALYPNGIWLFIQLTSIMCNFRPKCQKSCSPTGAKSLQWRHSHVLQGRYCACAKQEVDVQRYLLRFYEYSSIRRREHTRHVWSNHVQITHRVVFVTHAAVSGDRLIYEKNPLRMCITNSMTYSSCSCYQKRQRLRVANKERGLTCPFYWHREVELHKHPEMFRFMASWWKMYFQWNLFFGLCC